MVSVCLHAYSQTCSVGDQIDPGNFPNAEHEIPRQFQPRLGPAIQVGTTPDSQTQGQVRVVAHSSYQFPLAQYTTKASMPAAPAHQGSSNLGGFYGTSSSTNDSVPRRLPQDGFYQIGSYQHAGDFKYRLELCVHGSWVPITAPETGHTLAFSEKYRDDLYTVTYGSKQARPDPGNVLATVVFSLQPKELEAHADYVFDCKGLPGAVAFSHSSIHGYVKDHETGQDVQVESIGVAAFFDGETHILPKLGHGSLIVPGGDPLNPGQGYVDKFPYGQINRSASDTASVTLTDDVFAVKIGGACRAFTAVTRVIMYDGQVLVAAKHSD